MAPRTPTHTTQTTEVKLPEWVDQASESNYQYAQEIAAKPYTEYGGQTVAGTSQTTDDAYNFFRSTMGAGDAQRNEANQLFSQAGQGVGGMNIQNYMNPFIDNVENQAMSALDKSRVQSLMGNSDAAIASNAFGGSRHGVVDAVTNSETAQKAGMLSAELRKGAYDNATGLMQQDIQNMTSGGQGLLAGAGVAAGQRGKDFAGLLGIGQQEQQQTQMGLDDQYNRWREGQDHDVNQLNVLLSSLGMSPYGKSETTDKVTSGGGGTDMAQMGLGALSLLFGLFSDRDAKTDIKKLGKDPATGLDLYAYRYKGDPKSYPKVVGPMAQDVEKLFPGSTVDIGGNKTIRIPGHGR